MNLLKIVNLPIVLTSFLLVSIGVLVIYSSSAELAIQQTIFTFAGLIFFFLVSQIELSSIRSLIKPFYIFIAFLLVVVLILGIETRGSLRWIPLGIFNVQPSEFAKPALILLLAKFWSEKPATWINIFKSLLWTSPVMLLIFKQPDLGSTLTITAIWLGMLIAARVSFKKIILLALIFLMVIPVGWIFLQPYQKERIVSFLAPQSDPLGRGYNVIQSTIAVGSGEIFGRGLGRGTQTRLRFLPEFRTDFIFASIAEELGFLASFSVLVLYSILVIRIFKIVRSVSGKFGILVLYGVLGMF